MTDNAKMGLAVGGVAVLIGVALVNLARRPAPPSPSRPTPAHVTCYSAGRLIWEGDSPEVWREFSRPGFVIRTDGGTVAVSGDCVVVEVPHAR